LWAAVRQISMLESLSRTLLVEVMELRRERERAAASRTLYGHCENLMGYMLSLYCLFKCAAPAFC
jgi:golgi pH regulator